MEYLGKTYNHSKDENFKEYLTCFGLPADKTEALSKSKPTSKLEKNGDTFILTSTDSAFGSREVKFQSGVEFEEALTDSVTVKSKYNVDGNVINQTQTLRDGRVLTIKREYSGNSLVVTSTISNWDGTARRVYTA